MVVTSSRRRRRGLPRWAVCAVCHRSSMMARKGERMVRWRWGWKGSGGCGGGDRHHAKYGMADLLDD
uniref:Uncharacterized protein n=1 Tax=Oryza rufipogon TaxID=4529 RepID=A0A0E0RDT3_ORYRU